MNDPRRDTVLPLRPRRQRSDDLAWSTTHPETAPWNRPLDPAEPPDEIDLRDRPYDAQLLALRRQTTQDFADLVVFIEEGIIARMEDLARRLDVLERPARR